MYSTHDSLIFNNRYQTTTVYMVYGMYNDLLAVFTNLKDAQEYNRTHLYGTGEIRIAKNIVVKL
ncbi:hypothetical protein [Marinitoga lauensis]|uniref:hypothetical protein n=1 Tax=Marinitoga lauensis TaxID=2201189 RepID=UPI001013AAC3|nr:hypothetical protein [Marinitoga lauensis]